jgi:endonuclease IV
MFCHSVRVYLNGDDRCEICPEVIEYFKNRVGGKSAMKLHITSIRKFAYGEALSRTSSISQISLPVQSVSITWARFSGALLPTTIMY